MIYTFHPASEIEHLETIAYYESCRPGLGALYLSEFEAILSNVCKYPDRFPIEKNDIHRVRMDKFPFAILYRECCETIQVLAVAHNRRRPMYWLGR